MNFVGNYTFDIKKDTSMCELLMAIIVDELFSSFKFFRGILEGRHVKMNSPLKNAYHLYGINVDIKIYRHIYFFYLPARSNDF